MKSAIHFFILILALMALVSCEGDQTVRFRFTKLELEHLSSEGGNVKVTGVDSMQKELYGIRMNLFPVETFRKGRYFDPETPAEEEDRIKYIYITSDQDFDNDHPANTLLNEKFYYFPGNFLYSSPLKDSTCFPVLAKYLPDFPDNNFPDYADLLLIGYSENNLPRKFYIKLKFQSGSTFSDSTSIIKLY
jgi:hypothetical protein